MADINDQPISEVPFDMLQEQGKRQGMANLEKGGREYFSNLGKRSAKSPMRTREYYAELGRRSAASKKAKKAKRLQEAKNPLNTIAKMLSGKI